MTCQSKTVVFLERGDPELVRAWATFADPVAMHPKTSEVWQYLGTGYDALSGWTHCFRHRHHPDTNQREYRWTQASPGWSPKGRKSGKAP